MNLSDWFIAILSFVVGFLEIAVIVLVIWSNVMNERECLIALVGFILGLCAALIVSVISYGMF